jgi:hypothetical protein
MDFITRLQVYGGALTIILLGILAENGIKLTRVANEHAVALIYLGILLLAYAAYMDWTMAKEKKVSVEANEKEVKKKDYKKIILSTLGLLYLVIHLFKTGYTNDIGMLIALGVMFYTNDGLSIFKKKDDS